MPFPTCFKPTLPRAPGHHITIAALVLIAAVTAAGIFGLFAEPQHAHAWMTTTGANWKSTSAYSLDPPGWVNTGSTIPGNLWNSQLAIIGDYVYLFGGNPTIGTRTNVIYRAPLSNPLSWSSVGSLPANLAASQLAIIGDYVYLFDGRTGNTSYTNVIYRAPLSNPTSWTNTGSTLPGNLGGSSLAIIGDYVYLFGSPSSNRAIYRAPLSNPTSWVDTGSAFPYSFNPVQLTIISDYVYIFGGYGGSNYNAIYRAPLTALTPGTPGSPTFANVTSSSMRVSWTVASAATSYKVERCEGAGCSDFTEIASGITGLFLDDTGLAPNTSYSYRVRGTNTAGDGPYSATGTRLTDAPPASSPTVATDPATAIASTSATLNGTITGSAGITQHSFAYGTSANLTTGVSTTTLGGAPGISFIGGTQNAAAGSAVTVDISGLGLQEGDVVLVSNAINNGNNGDMNPGVQMSGYSEIADIFGNGTTNDLNLSVNWKVMSSSPDTSVACNSSGSASLASVCIVQAYRGVDTSTPMDVATTTANGSGAGIPNPPSITPSTSGAWVVVSGGGGAGTPDASVTAPTGYSNQTEDTLDVTNDGTAAMASKAWTSGTEDPAAWTGWATTGSGASWAAVTMALRPASIGAAFEENVSSSPGTTYFFRAYATSAGGTGFGSILSFATPGSSCTFNSQPVNHGNSATAYQSQVVPYGESCVSEQRTCTDGTLSGSYQYATCSPASPPPSGEAINGWAWSETIGWLSLHGTTYGLYIDEDGYVAGYAWSENIGWVSAEEDDLAGCPQAPCYARMVSDKLIGWLRALAADDEYAAGWDGWIALSDMTPTDDADYGVSLETSGTFSGFAWGEMIVGWLDFGQASTTYTPCEAQYQCTDATHRDNLCTTDVVENEYCGAGNICSPDNGLCTPPGNATGNLNLNPALVPTGNPTRVSWDVADTYSCRVFGDNGDEWFGGATGVATSSAIIETTKYTLECANAFGEATTTIDTAYATVVPTWVER